VNLTGIPAAILAPLRPYYATTAIRPNALAGDCNQTQCGWLDMRTVLLNIQDERLR
jgi:hypothetical protein